MTEAIPFLSLGLRISNQKKSIHYKEKHKWKYCCIKLINVTNQVNGTYLS